MREIFLLDIFRTLAAKSLRNSLNEMAKAKISNEARSLAEASIGLTDKARIL